MTIVGYVFIERLLIYMLIILTISSQLTILSITPTISNTEQIVIYVPDDYPTISDALAHVDANATIYVRSGVYKEYITITYKYNIRIIGLGNVVIDGEKHSQSSYWGTAIDVILSGNIVIENIVVRNSSIGISIINCKEVTLKNIVIINCSKGIGVLMGSNITLDSVSLINSSLDISIDVLGKVDIINSTINGKDIVHLKNRDLGNKSIKELYPDPGVVIVYNCSNMVIENLDLYMGSKAITIVSSKNIVVSRNHIHDLCSGLYIGFSKNILIIGNNISNTRIGIQLFLTTNIRIINNSLNDIVEAGIDLRGSHNVEIINNRISCYGLGSIVLDCRVSSLSITNTSLYGSGITVRDELMYVLRGISIENSFINDKPIILLKDTNLKWMDIKSYYPIIGQLILYNVSNIVIRDYVFNDIQRPLIIVHSFNVSIENIVINRSVIGIQILYSINTTLSNITIAHSRYGVYIMYSTYIVVRNSTLCRCKILGISIYSSHNLVIKYNRIYYNVGGIKLSMSNEVILDHNIVYNNSRGILLDSVYYAEITMNTIYGNSIVDMEIVAPIYHYIYLNILGNKVFCRGGDVYWFIPRATYIYNGRVLSGSLGNYWINSGGDDIDGDGIYDASINDLDSFPLVSYPYNYTIIDRIDLWKPFLTILEPRNMSIVYGNITIRFIYGGYGFHSRGIYMYIDGKYTSQLKQQIYTLNTSKLADGLHKITIVAHLMKIGTDIIKVSDTIYLYIDNDPPKIRIIEPENYTIIYSGELTISWEIIEASIENITLYVDDTQYTVSVDTGTYTIDTDKLDPGLHNITIYARDKLGRESRVSVFFIKGIEKDKDLVTIHSQTSTIARKTPYVKLFEQTTILTYILPIIPIIVLLIILWIKRSRKHIRK